MTEKIRRSGKVNAYAFAQLIKALSEGGTRKELAEATGLHPLTVGHYVSELRRAKMVYIHHWEPPEPPGRNDMASYKLGSLPDARKRKPLTPREVKERYRQAQRQRVSSVFAMRPL